MGFGIFQGYCGAYIITHIDMTILNSTWWSKTVKREFFSPEKKGNIPNAFGCEVSHFPKCTVVKAALCAHTTTRYNMKKNPLIVTYSIQMWLILVLVPET